MGHRRVWLYLRETGVRELGPLGSGRHPSHSTSPSGPGDEVARGIAGEKFDIVKKWGINTYKVRFTCLLSETLHGNFFPFPRSHYTVFALTKSMGVLECFLVGMEFRFLTSHPLFQSVHKAAVIREVWPRLPDCGSGAGAAD